MINRVFISTPISGFSTQNDYLSYRRKVLKLIEFLRANDYEVCSEVESISSEDKYDSPAKSVKDDFESIERNDFFILLHPARMQTSSLIELGYACAKNRKIIAVGKKNDFPYLVIGFADYNSNARIIETEDLDEAVFHRILDALKKM